MIAKNKILDFFNKYKLRMALWVMILIVIVPIIIYASKSFPCADDFGNSGLVRDQMVKGSYFLTAIKLAFDNYFNIGGYFFGAFLNYFFSPFLRMGITGIRIFNPVVHILFYTSAFFFVSSFCKYIIKIDIETTLLIYLSFIVCLVNNRVNDEVYSWYVVMTGYILPVTVMLASNAILTISFSKKNKLYIISIILSFLVSLSSLDITALNCGLLLLAVLYCYSANEFKIESTIVFLSALVGALVSVIAPGNFKRHDGGGTEYYIVGSLNASIMHSAEEIFGFITRTPILIFVIIVFFILFFKTDFSGINISMFKHPFIAAFVAFLGVVIVNYPVFLGTGHTAKRCEFIQDIAIYILLFLWLFYFAGYLKSRNYNITISMESVIVLSATMFLYGIAIMNYHGGLDSFTTPYMVKSIANGEFAKYVEYNEGIIEELEKPEGKDVVIYNPEYISNPYMKDMNIRPNDQAYTNHTMTRYYGLNSLRLYDE